MADAESHMQYLREVYAAWVQGNLDPLYAHLDDAVDWRSIGEDGYLPWSGTWEGRAGVAGYFHKLDTYLDIISFELVDMLADDCQVACLCRVVCARKGAEQTIAIDKVDLFTFKGDKIVKFWEVYALGRMTHYFDPMRE